MNEQAACTLIWQYVNKLPKKDVRMRPSTAFTTVELTKDYKLCVPNYTESIRINVFASHAALSLIPNDSWRTHRIESVCVQERRADSGPSTTFILVDLTPTHLTCINMPDTSLCVRVSLSVQLSHLLHHDTPATGRFAF